MFAAKAGDGVSIKGHSTGLVNTGNFTHKDGAESEKTTVTFQLTNANEYNADGALLDPTSNGFDVDVIKGIVDAEMTIESIVTTSVVVSVKAAANNSISIQGLLNTDFRGVGTAETVDSIVYDSSLEQYTLTFSADVSAVPLLTIELYDDALSLSVVEVAGVFYQGESGILA